MYLMLAKLFESSKNGKCVLDKGARVFLRGNANMPSRYKSKVTKPKAVIINKYEQLEEPIGLYGYCLLSIPICTFALGTWQIKRWRWKLDLIENLKQRTTAEPIDLPDDLDKLKNKEYCHVKMMGKFLYDKEFLMGPRSLIVDGEALSEKGSGLISGKSSTGYYVITPFKLEDRNLVVLVNRGWIPKNARSTYKQENKIIDSIEIVGIVRKSEKRPPFIPANAPKSGVWHYRNLEEMAKIAETDPIYIELSPGYGMPGGPIGGQTKVTLRNEHLSYIVTWYGLSASTAYMWFRYFIQKLPLL